VVGVARSTLYLPFDVRTAAGEPFAEAVRTSLVASLSSAGYSAAAEDDQALQVEIDVKEWETDGYFGELTLTYDLALRASRADQEPLAVVRSGEATGEYANRATYGKACRSLFADVFSDLLSKLAPSRPPPRPTPATSTCSRCEQALEPKWKVCPYCATPR
jgi:hypothetical protein